MQAMEHSGFGIVVGLIFAAGGLLLMRYAGRQRKKLLSILNEGIRREATVIGFTKDQSDKRSPRPIVQWIRANGDVSVLSPYWSGGSWLKVGQKVNVRYQSDDLSCFIIEECSSMQSPALVVMSLMGGFFLLIGAVVVVAALRDLLIG